MVTGMMSFLKDEDGAVTVDFVVITAAIVVMGLVVGSSISSGGVSLASKQGESLADRGLGPASNW